MSISEQQHNSTKDPGIKGPLWVSKVTLEPPTETDALDALTGAVDALKPSPDAKYDVPEVLPVEAEWTGYRAHAKSNAPRPQQSEAEHYAALINEVTSDVVVLYLHGGALYLMDPATHRPVCSQLAHKTGGRCLSVRYRLAPAHPFPAALLDAFVAYLSLLAPPPGAPHAPVAAKNIVFAGDSAGGTLSFALLQLLLQLRRTSKEPTVRFHGRNVELALPAGVATHSAWLDISISTPSYQRNQRYDYLPPPRPPPSDGAFPKCELWPAKAPRGDLYCDVSMLTHPLVSPAAARDWAGAPPLFMLYGEELLADEGAVTARRAARQGVPVRWLQFEAMPHTPGLILVGSEMSKKSYAEWAGFIARVVKGEELRTGGTWVAAKTLREAAVDVKGLVAELDDEEVERRMREAVRKRDEGQVKDEKLMARL